jgi:hypothetical protein
MSSSIQLGSNGCAGRNIAMFYGPNATKFDFQQVSERGQRLDQLIILDFRQVPHIITDRIFPFITCSQLLSEFLFNLSIFLSGHELTDSTSPNT